jgi:hypothetical protein
MMSNVAAQIENMERVMRRLTEEVVKHNYS